MTRDARAQVSGPAQAFNQISNAPLSTDLPQGQSSSNGVPGSLRPDITYPTLRLDTREPRRAQPKRPAPDFKVETPEPPASPFQKMVEQTLGYRLPVYGQELFTRASPNFEPVDRADIPASFVLGPGDEIVVRAWGAIDLDVRATLDREGMISLPKVGQIPLRGVRYDELKDYLNDHLSKFYRDFELSVALGQLRSVQVYVTGFARRPGVYTVSALASPLNILFFAGGAEATGNLRAVEHRRDRKVLNTLDFYEFIRYGRFDTTVRIEPGDVLHIPALESEVALAGAVRRPGIYQLLPGETLDDAIALAGGLEVTASTHRLVVERLVPGEQRDIVELAMDARTRSAPMRTGDLVLIQPISAKFSNAITLRGNVATPLRHQWRPGLRVADLIPSAEALIAPGYWIKRNEQDQVAEFLSKSPDSAVSVDFPDINWEYAVVERTDPASWRTDLLPFDLHKAVFEKDPGHNIALEPGDRITVFAINDFRVRRDQKTRFIRVEGEVGKSGYYPATPDQTIADVIEQAGGLTPNAYLYGLEFSRQSVRAKQRKRINESIDR
ncbi:MAG: SLBB domain-containing protein, partial [Pseudomonadota bacterium]